MKRRYVHARDIYVDFGDEIIKKYENGETIEGLCEMYMCSTNTMLLTLGMLGFRVPAFLTKRIETQLKRVEKYRTDRIRNFEINKILS